MIIGVVPRSLINFRGNLINLLIQRGHSVTALASMEDQEVILELNNWKVNFCIYPVVRNRVSPLVDLKTWYALRAYFLTLKPNVIFAYTIKPVIWGGIASRVSPNARFFALITGLGFAFQGGTIKRRLLKKAVVWFYRFALGRAERVIFQNPDNLYEFVRNRIVMPSRCALVNGSGVDVNHFSCTPLPQGTITFLSIGRLLGEKGFREYAEAARIVRALYPSTRFQLLGPEDPSLDGIPYSEISQWHKNGWLDYLGVTDDVRPYLRGCHVYVLPSYHEGLPRTVLEAMAVGRPIITTDVPGCRETVNHGANGFLIPKADVKALAERMIWFINNQTLCEEMGKRSREIVEEKYDVRKVNERLMQIMEL